MKPRRQSSRAKKQAPVGQADIFGKVHGLDKLVQPPDVIDSEGLKVIHFAISQEDKSVPGYLAEVKEQARRLLPETKSVGKPPWMRAEWQAKRRKARDAAG